jgi:hypothetical protein
MSLGHTSEVQSFHVLELLQEWMHSLVFKVTLVLEPCGQVCLLLEQLVPGICCRDQML